MPSSGLAARSIQRGCLGVPGGLAPEARLFKYQHQRQREQHQRGRSSEVSLLFLLSRENQQ